MANARTLLLHAVGFVCCFVLVGCVLAEVHASISPLPPWFTLDAKGFAADVGKDGPETVKRDQFPQTADPLLQSPPPVR